MQGSDSDRPTVSIGKATGASGGIGVAVYLDQRRLSCPSNLPRLGKSPWVGRQEELAFIEREISEGAVVVLHGPPGVGKSALARAYARMQAEARYPGGVYQISGTSGSPLYIELVRLAESHAGLALEGRTPQKEDLAQSFAALTQKGRSLLIYDDIGSPEDLGEHHAWLPPEHVSIDVIITTNHLQWDSDFTRRAIPPLPVSESVQLLEALDEGALSAEDRLRLATAVQGIVAVLRPLGGVVAENHRRGRRIDIDRLVGDLHKHGDTSYAPAWGLLDEPSRRLVSICAWLASGGFDPALACQLCAMEPDIAAFDQAQDLSLLEGDEERLQMHGLLGRWIRENHPPRDDDQRRLVDSLLDFARRVKESPKDVDAVGGLRSLEPQFERLAGLVGGERVVLRDIRAGLAALGMFELAEPWGRGVLATWAGLPPSAPMEIVLPAMQGGGEIAPDFGQDLHEYGDIVGGAGNFGGARTWLELAVAAKERGLGEGLLPPASLGSSLFCLGLALSHDGAFEDALPYLQRAVQLQEKGPPEHPVDYSSLGSSLHLIGNCHYQRGDWDSALQWYAQACEVASKGDLHGRIDHSSLGGSLHEVGNCHSQRGDWDSALQWFNQACEAARKGDLYGRIDHSSLGGSLHAVGNCHFERGDWDSALQWFTQAYEAASKGDLHGRMDLSSLGSSLHRVGSCHYQRGDWDSALQWFTQACEAEGKGDLHGRIDHSSLGRSLHEVGNCHFERGDWDSALQWFTQACEAKSRGDLHGRIDHSSLGCSLHQMGMVHLERKEWKQARVHFDRARVEGLRGDIYGRIDHTTVAKSCAMNAQAAAASGALASAKRLAKEARREALEGDIYGRVDHALVEECRKLLRQLRAK